MNIILIGPPGSGKSTQGDLLSKKLHIPYYSVGQILRRIAQSDRPDAKKIEGYLNSGNLLPNDVVMPIIEEHLEGKNHENGFILDGFPRIVEQAEKFKHPIDKVIYIDLPDKEALWRIAKRTDKRHDQSAMTILHRLELYHKEIDKVHDLYEKQGILIKIDGMPSAEEIHKNILQAVGFKS